MTYTEAVNDYGFQEEFWNNEKLQETCSYNETEDVPIYFKIIKKYENIDGSYKNDTCLWIHENDTVNHIKLSFIEMIDNDTTDKEKLEILSDMKVACEEWESRHLRRNIRKLLEDIINEEIKYDSDNDNYIYTDESKQIKKDIEQVINNYLYKYNIKHSFGIKCKPLRNGTMIIDIYNSNRINEKQINAIERIIRGRYSCGKVQYRRDGSIQNIDHRFITKYYAGRYVHR